MIDLNSGELLLFCVWDFLARPKRLRLAVICRFESGDGIHIMCYTVCDSFGLKYAPFFPMVFSAFWGCAVHLAVKQRAIWSVNYCGHVRCE